MSLPKINIEIPDGKQLFVVMAMMRSGSNLLQQKLNGIEGVLCHGEVFNTSQSGLEPKFEKTEARLPSLKSIDRKSKPGPYLKRLIELSQAEHVGFRLFENHHNDLIQPLIEDPRIFKIVLIRDFLESYVSLEIARQNDQWIMNRLGTRKEWKPIKVNFEAFKTYALRESLFYHEIISRCMLTGQKYLALDYSDLNTAKTDGLLLGHFGVHRVVDKSGVTAQRQNPEVLEEKIENYDEIRKRLRNLRLDRWLLTSGGSHVA